MNLSFGISKSTPRGPSAELFITISALHLLWRFKFDGSTAPEHEAVVQCRKSKVDPQLLSLPNGTVQKQRTASDLISVEGAQVRNLSKEARPTSCFFSIASDIAYRPREPFICPDDDGEVLASRHHCVCPHDGKDCRGWRDEFRSGGRTLS